MENGNDYLEWAASVAADPVGAAATAHSEWRPVYGVMCSYVPEEIIYAAGILPFRILGRGANTQLADKRLPAYCCSQARGSVDDLLSGIYGFLSGALFSHTCDTMQCVYEIVKMNLHGKFIHMLNFPSRLDSPAAFDFTLGEIRHFKEKLESHTSKTITDESLQEAAQVYNRNRELLGQLYDLHAARPDDVPSVALLNSVKASFYTDKREVNERLGGYMSSFGPGGNDSSRERILLIGNIATSEGLYTFIDEYGGTVVDDDMCVGRRYFSTAVAGGSLESLVRRYFDRPHCPAKHRSNTSRLEYVLGLAASRKADGALFIHLKFCDPHSFDYPYIRAGLDKAGVPSQLVEFEQGADISGQLRTKIQAFSEMLSAKRKGGR